MTTQTHTADLLRFADFVGRSPEQVLTRGCRALVHELVNTQRTIATIKLLRDLTGLRLMTLKMLADNAWRLTHASFDPAWEAIERGDEEPLQLMLNGSSFWLGWEEAGMISALLCRTFALSRRRASLLYALTLRCRRPLFHALAHRQSVLSQRLTIAQKAWEETLF